MAEIDFDLRAGEGVRSRAAQWTRLADWAAPAFAIIAIVAVAFGFVGFARSNYDIDELFTLFLIDHHGGLAEVVRRALTDTHPPIYYLFLYEWTRLFGLSETATRLPSAIFATAALAVFAVGMRRTYSRGAVAFACAVAATSEFWLYQAQNARNYALCILCSAVLLTAADSLVRAPRTDGRFPWGRWLALALAGALSAFSHFYMLLTTGVVLGLLILRIRDRRLQAALALTGLAILGPSLVYIRALLHHTQQNIHHMWFQSDPASLIGVVWSAFELEVGAGAMCAVGLLILLLFVGLLLRRRWWRPAGLSPAARWTALFSALVLAGVYAVGVAICFIVAPSISDQNLLVAAPMAWALLAALYEAVVPGKAPIWRAAVVVLCVGAVGSELVTLRGRFLPRIEQWRDPANYIASLPQCAGQTIPIVVPPVFGPDTPFFRQLAQRYFFGRYFTDWKRLQPFSVGEFEKSGVNPRLDALLTARAHDAGACPVLAWAVHDFDEGDAQDLEGAMEDLPTIDGTQIRLHEFFYYEREGLRWTRYPSGFVVELGKPDPRFSPAD